MLWGLIYLETGQPYQEQRYPIVIHCWNQQCAPHHQQLRLERKGVIVGNSNVTNFNHINCRNVERERGDSCMMTTSGNDWAVRACNCHVGMGIQLVCMKATVRSHQGTPNCCGQHQGAHRSTNRCFIPISQWPYMMGIVGPSGSGLIL
jgi:hypothetical protein